MAAKIDLEGGSKAINATDIETKASELFKIQDLGVFLANTVNFVITVAAILCLVFLLWGGIQWIMSQGDKAKYEEARNKITYAIIGLAIVACSWLLWQLALYFLGIGTVSEGQVILNLPNINK